MNVGFIGVGAMGSGMAKNAAKNGFVVFAYDTDLERAQNLANDINAQAVNSIEEMAKQCDVVFTMLPVSPLEPYLEDTVAGPNGLLEYMRPGTIIADGGNTSPTVVKTLAAHAENRGVHLIDTPVSGGPQGAHAGTLSILFGGPEELLEKLTPLLESLGKNITYMGPTGSGQMAKLVNNMIVAINLAGLSEALVFAEKMGLRSQGLLDAFTGGAADSWVLRNPGRQFVERHQPKASNDPVTAYLSGRGVAPANGKPKGGRDRQLNWAINMGAEQDVPLPLTAMSHELYKMARATGKVGGFKPLLEFFEELAEVSVGEDK